MQDVTAILILQDVQASDVRMHKSCKQRGVDTPKLLNFSVGDSWRGIDEHILKHVLTFIVDDMPIAVLVWAENIWIIADDMDSAAYIMTWITCEFAKKGLH